MKATRRVLTYELCAVIASSAVCALAQQKQPQLVVNYVSPSLLAADTTPSAVKQNKANASAEARVRDGKIITSTPVTSADRWLEFEREYAVREGSPSRFLRMLQSAKYGLDKMAFTAKETARKLEFTYDFGDNAPGSALSVPARPAYSLPMFGKFGQPQLRSVLDEHDSATGTPFVGLKLTIPFGKGAAEGRHGG